MGCVSEGMGLDPSSCSQPCGRGEAGGVWPQRPPPATCTPKAATQPWEAVAGSQARRAGSCHPPRPHRGRARCLSPQVPKRVLLRHGVPACQLAAAQEVLQEAEASGPGPAGGVAHLHRWGRERCSHPALSPTRLTPPPQAARLPRRDVGVPPPSSSPPSWAQRPRSPGGTGSLGCGTTAVTPNAPPYP